MLPMPRQAPKRLLAVLTTRSIIAISTTCAILYGVFWGVSALQASTIVSGPIGAAVTQPLPAQAILPAANAPAAAGLTLEVQISPSVQPWLTDAAGQGAGVNPDTGLVRLQPKGSAFTGVGTDPQTITIPNASGAYQVQLTAPADGSFDLHVRVYQADRAAAREYAGSGQIQAGGSYVCTVTLGQDGDGTPTVDVTPLTASAQAPAAGR